MNRLLSLILLSLASSDPSAAVLARSFACSALQRGGYGMTTIPHAGQIDLQVPLRSPRQPSGLGEGSSSRLAITGFLDGLAGTEVASLGTAAGGGAFPPQAPADLGALAGAFGTGVAEGWVEGVVAPVLPPLMLYKGVQQLAGLARIASNPSGFLDAMTPTDWARMAGNMVPYMVGGGVAGTRGALCFAPDTKIATPSGFTDIEDLEAGDEVWAFDAETGELAVKKVSAIHHREVESSVELWAGDEHVTTTAEHPFWVDGRGWATAKELAPGDVLWRLDGGTVEMEDVVDQPWPLTVYNLEVEGFQTFFVSSAGILVHNKTPVPRVPAGQVRAVLGLSAAERATFAGGAATRTVLAEDLVATRVFSRIEGVGGAGSGIGGRFFTTEAVTSGAQTARALALPPGNSAVFVEQALIPRGTVVYSGRAASLFGQPGGGGADIRP